MYVSPAPETTTMLSVVKAGAGGWQEGEEQQVGYILGFLSSKLNIDLKPLPQPSLQAVR